MKAYFVLWSEVNPYVTNGQFHSNHFDESILILGTLGECDHFYVIFR